MPFTLTFSCRKLLGSYKNEDVVDEFQYYCTKYYMGLHRKFRCVMYLLRPHACPPMHKGGASGGLCVVLVVVRPLFQFLLLVTN